MAECKLHSITDVSGVQIAILLFVFQSSFDAHILDMEEFSYDPHIVAGMSAEINMDMTLHFVLLLLLCNFSGN